MNEGSSSVVSGHGGSPRLKLKNYSAGFILSVSLTVAAYLLVTGQSYSKWTIAFAIAGLALTQFFVQLFCFLHLGNEMKPRWRLMTFSFMFLIVGILVGGSLWIMHSLNYNMITPKFINNYLKQQQDEDL